MLTLDKLAPYLPYKLKVDYLGKTVTMNAGPGSSKNWIGITALIQRKDKCKPILRPLSDLNRPCLENGEIPILKLEEMFGHTLETVESKHLIQPITCEPYILIRQLTEWHFDVFGLIRSGDAISFNSTAAPKEGEALVRFKEGHPNKNLKSKK